MSTPEVEDVVAAAEDAADLAQVGHGDVLSTAESAAEAGLQSPCYTLEVAEIVAAAEGPAEIAQIGPEDLVEIEEVDERC